MIDFLVKAYYNQIVAPIDFDGVSQNLAGIVVARFDERDIVKRPMLEYLSAEQARSPASGLNPYGFGFSEDGKLLSDTQSYEQCSFDANKVLSVINMNESVTYGLLDLVLLGADTGSILLVGDYVVEMRTLKVSKTSYNIYAPYKTEDGAFRTYSLVDKETRLARELTMAIPTVDVPRFSHLSGFMEELEGRPKQRWLDDYTVFKVNAPLYGFWTFAGEAFCNFLAYMVGYYSIGLKVTNFLKHNYLNVPVTVSKQEQVKRKPPIRTGKPPLIIESTLSKAKIREFVDALSNGKVDEFRASSEEARVTTLWMEEALGVLQDDDPGRLSKLLELESSITLANLSVSIELLAQRLLLDEFPVFPSGVFMGGGVNGKAIKRTAW